MVHLTRLTPEATTQHITDQEVTIIVEALLHEMERYNKALDLVTDENARHAIYEAKDKVYKVFQKMNCLTVDE